MKKITTLILSLKTLFLISQTTLYVNKNVQGGQQNGGSWANAFSDLQPALAAAAKGDSIWVAAGTYFPTAGVDRSVSFVLKQGIKLFGGFSGTETQIAQRDVALYPVILSGNIGAPGGADNSYHVLYGIDLDSTTVLDGFTITKGAATGDDQPASTSWGGGLLLEYSSLLYINPLIQNCTFLENYAVTGGAMYCAGASWNYINPLIRNCLFSANRAQLSGGAVYKAGASYPDFPFEVKNCTFSKNSASLTSGGACHLDNPGNATIFSNCFFEKDSARLGFGGGIYCENIRQCELRLEFCSFKENYADEAGAVSTFFDTATESLLEFEVDNCIFEKNKAANGRGGVAWLSGENESKTNVLINNCVFANNISATYGTTIVVSGNETNLELDHSIFLHNTGPTNFQYGSRFTVSLGGLKVHSNIKNCLFARNDCALGLHSPMEAIATHRITNCTFFQNGKYVIEKNVVPIGVLGLNECYITNSIFEEKTTYEKMFSDFDLIEHSLDGYHIDYSLLSLDTNITPADDAFGHHTIFMAHPDFMDTLNYDFRLKKCSPGVNFGNNTVVDTLGILTDLDGNMRIAFDTVDAGAYESQEPCYTNSAEEHFSLQNIKIWPNPAPSRSILYLETPETGETQLKWNIRNIYGALVSSGTRLLSPNNSVPISTPEMPGVYFVELRLGERSGVFKLTIE